MSLSIPQNFITNLDDFEWGAKWRATRIIKEKRTSGEFYFANIVRYYGEIEETHDIDIAETYADRAWLGRLEKFVGKRSRDLDQDSPTAGKRVYTEAITETITENNLKGKPVEREVLVKGKVVYEYLIPVTPENTKKMKTLAGPIALNQETEFLFVYGAKPPHSLDPETFWETTVADYLKLVAQIPKKPAPSKK